MNVMSFRNSRQAPVERQHVGAIVFMEDFMTVRSTEGDPLIVAGVLVDVGVDLAFVRGPVLNEVDSVMVVVHHRCRVHGLTLEKARQVIQEASDRLRKLDKNNDHGTVGLESDVVKEHLARGSM